VHCRRVTASVRIHADSLWHVSPSPSPINEALFTENRPVCLSTAWNKLRSHDGSFPEGEWPGGPAK
jgi:hypothetical protein